MEMDEDKFFKRFVAICYVIAFFFFLCLVVVIVYGVPSFENMGKSLNEKRIFCHDHGGFPIEPSRDTYNQMLCLFNYNNTAYEYAIEIINNKEYTEIFCPEDYGKMYFLCWDHHACSDDIYYNKLNGTRIC